MVSNIIPCNKISIQGKSFMTSSEHEPKSAETNHHNPEKKKRLTKTQKIGAGIAVAVLLGVGGLAYNIYNNASHETNSSQTTTEKPAALKDFAANSALEKLEKVYSGAMEKYNDMDVDTFEALPLDERLLYSQYLIDRTAASGYYDGSYTNNTIDESERAYAIHPTPATTEDNGQEIINDYSYNIQISYLQHAEDGQIPAPFDASDGQKVLSSVFLLVGKDRNVLQYYTNLKEDEKTLKYPSGIHSNLIATDTSDLLTGKSASGEDIKYKIVTYYSKSDVKTVYTRFAYHEFTDYTGSRKAIWLSDLGSNEAGELQ
jgi:hypothetical protein